MEDNLKDKLKSLEGKIQRLQKAILFIIQSTDFDLKLLTDQEFDLSEFNLVEPQQVVNLDETVGRKLRHQRGKKSTGLAPNARWEAKQKQSAALPLLTPKDEPDEGGDDGDYFSNDEGEIFRIDTDHTDPRLTDRPNCSKQSFPNRQIPKISLGPYPCSHCLDIFEHKEDFDTHCIKIHGIKNKKIYTCEYCGKTDRWKGKHFNHVRTHTGEKPFLCSTCGHVAKTRQYLKEHMKIHSDFKPFPCDQCDQRFRRRPEVTQHKKKAHNINNDLMRTCPICKAVFSDNGKLTRHIRDIHEDKRTIQCHLCGQPFKRKEHLQKHLERHKNPKRRKRGPQKPNPRNKPPKEEGEEESGSDVDLIEEGGVPAPSALCETVLGDSSSRPYSEIRRDSDTGGNSGAGTKVEEEESELDLESESESDDNVIDKEEVSSVPPALCEAVFQESSRRTRSSKIPSAYCPSIPVSSECGAVGLECLTSPDDVNNVKDFQMELLD